MSPSPRDRVEWPLRTDRLSIRPATARDVEATWSYRRQEVVNRWITAAPTDLAIYHARFVEPVALAKTLVVERDGRLIGDLMLAVEDAWAQAEVVDAARGVQAELGWAFHPDEGGRGYAAEAVARLVRCCFEDLVLRRVTAQCFADNTASRGLMERVGMRQEALLVRDSLHRSGEWLDTACYALLAEEWPSGDRRS